MAQTQPFLTRRDVDAIDKNDELSAARMHLELNHQRDQSPSDAFGGDDAERTQAALDHLHRRFPNAHKVARHETSEQLGGLPRHLRTVQQRERDAAGMTSEDARAERTEHRARRESGGGGRGGGVVRPRAGATRGRSRPPRGGLLAGRARLRRRARRAGFTPAAMSGGWSQLAMEGFVGAVGLSLFYLLLTRGKAVAAISGGFGQAFAKLVSPAHDVFGGGAVATKAAGYPLADVADVALAGGDVTGLPVDITGLPGLTRTPPVPKVTRPRAPAHPTPTRLSTTYAGGNP